MSARPTTIIRWTEVPEPKRPALLDQLREIFFLTSSRKTFADAKEREDFYHHWTDFYFERAPDLIFLALDPEAQRLSGYLMGSDDSQEALSYYKTHVSSLFIERFAEFPGHLHINCHPEYQGKGIGRQLIEALCAELRCRGCRGVHLITSPTAENVGFYKRMGFTFTDSCEWHNIVPLLFMGKVLI